MVIPALDEEACIAAAVRSVRDDAEVIVVDGGSSDGTCAVAMRAGARIVAAPRSRGLQLDAGARSAAGEWLLFLHADTWLETGWATAIDALPPRDCGGAFRFAIDSPLRRYRAVEAGVRLRCRWLQLPYGDQALFVRRSLYHRLGGFAPIPLMEDVEFARRLARCGKLALLEKRAFTHPRRWERDGLVATTLRNWCVLGLYAVGCPADRLARIYGPRAHRASAVESTAVETRRNMIYDGWRGRRSIADPADPSRPRGPGARR